MPPSLCLNSIYLLCTHTWDPHEGQRTVFSNPVSPSMCVPGIKLRSWSLVQVPLLTEPPWCPAPNLLILLLGLHAVMEEEHYVCKMQSAGLGAGKPQGFGALGLGLAGFLQELSLCVSRGRWRDWSWAGMLGWGNIPQGRLTWASCGQSGKWPKAPSIMVGHNLYPESGLTTHPQQANKKPN